MTSLDGERLNPPTARRLRLREPVSGFMHLLGALLSVVGLVVLVCLNAGKPWHVTAFSIYGATLIVLFSASALHHLPEFSPRWIERSLVLDQIGIYLLIAGTYTPICLVSLRGPWGWSLFGVIWGLAVVGIALKIFWRRAPEWISLAAYLMMGWMCLIALWPLLKALQGPALGWLTAGGIFYSVGAVFFATDRPRLWPGRFGAHELWHLFVLAGSACHFVLMLVYVGRQP